MRAQRGWTIGLKVASTVAILFGALTIFSGGRALFGGPEARAAVGNAVPFVLWFNFLAGFAYIVTGVGLLVQRPWAIRLAWAIAIATLLVFAAFGIHVIAGGAFEMRTVGAMTLRCVFWIAVALLAARTLKHREFVSDIAPPS